MLGCILVSIHILCGILNSHSVQQCIIWNTPCHTSSRNLCVPFAPYMDHVSTTFGAAIFSLYSSCGQRFCGAIFFCSDDARILRPLTMAKYGRFTAPSGPYFVTNRCCRSPKPVARYMYIVFQPILMQDFAGDSPYSTGSLVFRACNKILEP